MRATPDEVGLARDVVAPEGAPAPRGRRAFLDAELQRRRISAGAGARRPPRISSTRCSRRRMTMPGGPSPPTSIVPGTRRAPVSSSMSRVATIWPSIACSGAKPFSKRPLASLRRPRTCEVRWMLGPFQLAASISTRVVPSWTSERSPPMTPAIEVGPSASSMTSICVERAHLPVEGGDLLAVPRGGRRAARRPRGRGRRRAAAPHQQHRVAGDVDDVVDAGRRPSGAPSATAATGRS